MYRVTMQLLQLLQLCAGNEVLSMQLCNFHSFRSYRKVAGKKVQFPNKVAKLRKLHPFNPCYKKGVRNDRKEKGGEKSLLPTSNLRHTERKETRMAESEERTIRGLKIRSTLTEKEIGDAAKERWSKGQGHSEETFVDLWDELGPEDKSRFLKAAEGSLGEDDITRKPDETTAELLERKEHNEELRAKHTQKRARSAFAAKIARTQRENVKGLFDELGVQMREERLAKEAAAKLTKEAEQQADLASENARRIGRGVSPYKNYEELVEARKFQQERRQREGY